MPLRSVCVYCGSANNLSPHYKKIALEVSTALAKRGLDLVYGGGHVGLMGIVADAALAAGGKVVGIIPEHIRAQEIQHTGLTKLHVVPDMHTRKRMMVENSDAFVILPGGLGTLDETFEIITWKKLHLHSKPIIIYNEGGFWNPLIQLIGHMVAENFAARKDLDLFTTVTSVDDMLAALAAGASAPSATKTELA
ncbi:MAG: TIGR00730 family Rossman fold protein [Bdellovibrionales bacterium]